MNSIIARISASESCIDCFTLDTAHLNEVVIIGIDDEEEIVEKDCNEKKSQLSCLLVWCFVDVNTYRTKVNQIKLLQQNIRNGDKRVELC